MQSTVRSINSLTWIPFFEYTQAYSRSMSEENSRSQGLTSIVGQPGPEFVKGSSILTQKRIQELKDHVPNICQGKDWELRFSPRMSGLSLGTFLRIGEELGPNVVAIIDESKNVFGAFMPSSWQTLSRFYGTGEIFLYTFYETESITCYYPSMINECYVSSDHERVIFGAG